jgi:hypothetical protein
MWLLGLDLWICPQPARRLARLFRPLRRVVSARRRSTVNAGARAVNAIHRHTYATHAAALALIDELLAIGQADPRAHPGAGDRFAARSERSAVVDLRAV